MERFNNKREVYIGFFILVVMAFFVIGFASVSAATYTLCSSGCDYDDLSEAFDGVNNTADIVVINGSGMYWMNTTSLYNISGTLWISADDVSLDFNGSRMIGDQTSEGIFVNASGNVTLENAFITNYTYLIHINSSSWNVTVRNSTLIASGTNNIPVYGSYVSGLNFTSNNISSDAASVFMFFINRSVFSNNTIYSSQRQTLLIGESPGMIITGNRFQTANHSLDIHYVNLLGDNSYNHSIDTYNTINGWPIVYFKELSNTIIENNESIGMLFIDFGNNITIQNLTFHENASGIALGKVENSTIRDITFQETFNSGISLYSSSHNTISNIYMVLAGQTDYGILSQRAVDNSFDNITGTSFTGLAYGAVFRTNLNSHNLTIRNSIFNNSGSGIVLSVTYYNNSNTFVNTRFIQENSNPKIKLFYETDIKFIDCDIDGFGKSIYYSNGGPQSTYLLNTSFNESGVTYHSTALGYVNYTVAWYLDVMLNNTAGAMLSGLNVSAYNSTGDFQFSAISVGGVARLNLTEFYSNLTHFFYEGNYTINVSGLGYPMQSFSVNMSENRRVNLTFECPTVVDYHWNITSNLHCSDQVLQMNNNLTINESANVFFDNVTLIINSTGGHNGIWSYGNLTINNSNITAYDPSNDYFWYNYQPGHLILERSVVTEFGWNDGSGSTGTTSGILLSTNGSMIRNNYLSTDTDIQHGISIYSGADNMIFNNTIYVPDGSVRNALLIKTSVRTNVSFNNITKLSLLPSNSNSFCIYVTTSNMTYLGNNTLYNTRESLYILNAGNSSFYGNTLTSTDGSGLQTYNSVNLNISDYLNLISDDYNTFNGLPIVIYKNASNMIIQNNQSIGQLIFINSHDITLRNITFPENSGGLSLISVSGFEIHDLIMNNTNVGLFGMNISYSNISDISIISKSRLQYAFYLGYGAHSTYQNITVNVTNNPYATLWNSAFRIDSLPVFGQLASNNTFRDCWFRSLNNSFGLVLNLWSGGEAYNRFDNVLFIYNSTYAIAFAGGSYEFIDSNISGSNTYDLYFTSYAKGYVHYFLNTTFNEDSIYWHASATDNYSIAWYLDMQVNDSAGNLIPNANISIYNRTGQFIQSALTDSNGFARLNVTHYRSNLTHRFYQTNHTINITSAYGTESYSLNMSTNRRLNITLSCPSVVDYWWNITSDVYCSDMEIIANSNITIESSANVLFDNVTLIMNSSGTDHIGIMSFGNLTVNNSNITAVNDSVDYFWWNYMPGKLMLDSSIVTEFGWNDGSGSTGTTSGILVQTNGSVVRHSRIVSDTDQQQGLVVYLGTDNVVFNNTVVGNIANSSYAILVKSAYSTNVSFNNVSKDGEIGASSLYLSYSNYSFVNNNTLLAKTKSILNLYSGNTTLLGNDLFSSHGRAIYFFNSVSKEMREIIYDSYNTINGWPIVFYKATDNLVIENNASIGMLIVIDSVNVTIQNLTFPFNSSGILLLAMDGCDVWDIDMNATSGGFYGENITHCTFSNININSLSRGDWASSITEFNHNIFDNLTINTTEQPFDSVWNTPLRLAASSSYNNVPTNNTFRNSRFISHGNNYGVTLNLWSGGIADNRFENVWFETNDTYGLVFAGGSVNLTDTRITGSSTYDLYFTSYAKGYVHYFLNTTFNEDSIYWHASATDNYSIAWYLDMQVNDSAGNLIPNANISIYNRTGQFIQSALTDSNGFARLNVTHYRSNLTHRFYQTNHTINITIGSEKSSFSINMSTNQHRDVQLTMAPPVVTFVGVTPTDPNANSYLFCVPQYTDIDGSTAIFDYKWYIDGALIPGENQKYIVCSGHENCTKGAKVSCAVNASDSYYTGSNWNMSANVTIQNKGPITKASYTDLNGDGYADIVFSNYYNGTAWYINSTIYFGNSTGEYSVDDSLGLPTIGAGTTIIDDMNNDGYPDIIIAGIHNGSSWNSYSFIFFGNSTGGFLSDVSISLPVSAAYDVIAADFDSDGYKDLVFANYRDDSGYSMDSKVYYSTGGFSSDNLLDLPTVGARSIASGDFDRDGYIDLVIGQIYDGVIYDVNSTVYYGNSTGGFSLADSLTLPTFGPRKVIADDLNGDGYLDLVFANERDSVSRKINSTVYFGNSTGGFSIDDSVALPTEGPLDVIADDLNGDGYKDLIFANSNNGTSRNIDSMIYYSNSTGGYSVSDSLGLPTSGVTDVFIDDLNLDGYKEIMFANPTNGTETIINCTIFFGNSSGGYSVQNSVGLLTDSGRLIDTYDLDGNGYPDVIFASNNLNTNSTIYYSNSTGGFNVGDSLKLPTSRSLGLSIAGIGKIGSIMDDIEDVAINMTFNSTINLSDNIYDPDGDTLSFTSIGAQNLTVTYDSTNMLVHIIGKPDFNGTSWLIINATDGSGHAVTNNFSINVYYIDPVTTVNISEFANQSGTTNLSNKTMRQLMNLSNFKLAKSTGSIQWLANTNLIHQNLVRHTYFASKLIAVNTSALDSTFNSSASLEVTGVDCSDYAIYRSSAFHNSAASVIAEATECPSNICTSVSCSGTTLLFTVSGFSSYAIGPAPAGDTPVTPTTTTPSSSGTSSGFAKNMESIIFNDVRAGQEKIFTLNNYLIAITKVSMTAKEFISKMKISVRSYGEAPYSLLESTIDGAYQYLKVSHENYFDNSQVEDIRFEFKVPKSWLGTDKAVLYRYNDGDWSKQKTEQTSTDSSYAYYTAYPEGLSYFAIAKEEAKVVPVKDTPITQTTEPTPHTPEPIVQSPVPTSQALTGQAINPTPHTTKPTPQTQQEKSWFAVNLTWIVAACVILLGLIIAGIIFITGRKTRPTIQQHDQKTIINNYMRQALVYNQPIPESIIAILDATVLWARGEMTHGHTKEELKSALIQRGWQSDLANIFLSKI